MFIEQIRSVSGETTVGASVAGVVGKIAGAILDHLHQPDELKKLAEELLAQQGQIVTAVTAGTAAEDEATEADE